MAAPVFFRSARTTTLLGCAATLTVAGTVYVASHRPLLLDSAQNAPSKTLAMPSGMLIGSHLTVTKVEQVNHDTKRITFRLPGGESEISGVPAGSAILTQHTPANAWLPVLRPYTPISPAEERGTLDLLVKQYPNGRASTYIHSLTPGQTLKVRGPIPGYSYSASPTSPRDLLFVAGGAGITPIYSLTQSILSQKDDQTRIHLLWGVNGTRDLILRRELDQLEQQFPERLRVTYCISGSENTTGNDASSFMLADQKKFRKGYVDRNVLHEAVDRCNERGAWGDAKGTKVLLCGPPAMENALAGKSGLLAELGVGSKNIHKF